MAAAAGVLGYSQIQACDLNVVGIPAAREIEGVQKAIQRFDRVLPNEIVRGVAVVAAGSRPMARL